MGALTIHIGIVGDFNRLFHSHWATEAAIFHSAARLGVSVEPHWVSTVSVHADASCLAGFDAIWGAPGSPFESAAGMLSAIRYAREHDVPYLGTCAGFQYALIEFTRSVLGVPDADTAENDPDGANIVITPVMCEIPGPPGTPRLLGERIVTPVSGTLLERLCGPADLRGEFFCSFETNVEFVPRWEAAGLRVGARDQDGSMRSLELPGHRFFMATLFQPQVSSSFQQPHPIVSGFLTHAAA